MTYCVGMLLDEGLVCLSDSRTNAGVDHINTFRKMTVFERPGDRVLVLMSAGNLAISQAVVSTLREVMAACDTRPSLLSVTNMFEAARHVGSVMRQVFQEDGAALKDFGVDFNSALILGGQIGQEPPRLFNVYAAGNFIEATRDTPYFQIGESKYGKPIIDRVLNPAISMEEAAKLALISMDSTIRSNLSVDLPLDLLTMRRDTLKVDTHLSIDENEPYFGMIRSRWGAALNAAFDDLPNPAFSTTQG